MQINNKQIIIMINWEEKKNTTGKIKYFSLEMYAMERTLKHCYSFSGQHSLNLDRVNW